MWVGEMGGLGGLGVDCGKGDLELEGMKEEGEVRRGVLIAEGVRIDTVGNNAEQWDFGRMVGYDGKQRW